MSRPPVLIKLRQKGVRVIINTKPIEEHDDMMADQAEQAIAILQDVGVKILKLIYIPLAAVLSGRQHV